MKLNNFSTFLYFFLQIVDQIYANNEIRNLTVKDNKQLNVTQKQVDTAIGNKQYPNIQVPYRYVLKFNIKI